MNFGLKNIDKIFSDSRYHYALTQKVVKRIPNNEGAEDNSARYRRLTVGYSQVKLVTAKLPRKIWLRTLKKIKTLTGDTNLEITFQDVAKITGKTEFFEMSLPMTADAEGTFNLCWLGTLIDMLKIEPDDNVELSLTKDFVIVGAEALAFSECENPASSRQRSKK